MSFELFAQGLPTRPVFPAGNGTNERFFRIGRHANYIAWDTTARSYFFVDSTVTPHDTIWFGLNKWKDYTVYGKWRFKNIVDFDSTVYLNDNVYADSGYAIGSPTFVSGWAGSGWKLDYGVTHAGRSNLEIDDATIRGNFNVYELLAHQIQGINGLFFISSSAKIDTVIGNNITFEDPTNSNLCPFTVNDLIMVQRFQPDQQTVVRTGQATVTVVSGKTVTVTINSGSFHKGDYAVRLGNTTNAARQASIYLAADDSNAPFIDMINGVNSWAAWGAAAKTKMRIGNLTGITNTAFGTLSGYGMYALDNIYLENGNISMGSSGYVRGGMTSYADTNKGFWLGYSGSDYKFKIYNSASKYFSYNGIDFELVGSIIRTAPIGQTRLEFNGSNNSIDFYTNSTNVGSLQAGPSYIWAYTPNFYVANGFAWGEFVVNPTTAPYMDVTSSNNEKIKAGIESGYPIISGTKSGATVGFTFDAPNTTINTSAGMNIGSSGFTINASGNIIKINNVITNFPSSQGAANTYLKNDGAGNLSWASSGIAFDTSKAYTITNNWYFNGTLKKVYFGTGHYLQLPNYSDGLTEGEILYDLLVHKIAYIDNTTERFVASEAWANLHFFALTDTTKLGYLAKDNVWTGYNRFNSYINLGTGGVFNGALRFFNGTTAYYTSLSAIGTTLSNKTISLPDKSGTVALTVDLPDTNRISYLAKNETFTGDKIMSGSLTIDEGASTFRFLDSGKYLSLGWVSVPTVDRIITFPDAAGTVALTSDLTNYAIAPATNTDNYIPLWNGTNSKTLKNGLSYTSAATASTIVSRDGSSNSYFNSAYANTFVITEPLSAYTLTLWNAGLTGNRTIAFPNDSGILTLQSRTLTINGTAHDLSTDASWTVGDARLASADTWTDKQTFSHAVVLTATSVTSVSLNATGRSYVNLGGSPGTYNLQTISNGTAGQILVLVGSSTTWTAKNYVSGSDNLRLAGGADFTMSTYDTLTLMFDGTYWIEISRSNN